LSQCTINSERCGGLCTGYQGQDIWTKRRKVTNEIPCETCREEANKLETFTHDIVNTRLGKKVYDKKNWDNFVDIVNCTNNSCKKEGRC